MYSTLPAYKSYSLIVWIPFTALTKAPNVVGMSAEKGMKLIERKGTKQPEPENEGVLGPQSIKEQIIIE